MEDLIIGLGIIDLMSGTLSSGIDTNKCDTSTELTVHGSAALFNIRSGLRTDNV